MAILESLIVLSCSGVSGMSNQACNKAESAGAQQSGVEKMSNSFEDHQVKLLEKDANEWFGKDVVGVAGGTVWVTKSIVGKKATFGIYGPLSTEIGSNVTKLILKWSF